MALSAQDRVEMMQLVARYNHAADAGDAEAWADTFTADGVFKKDDGPELTGRAALVQMVRQRDPGNARHWTLNFIIEQDGEGERASMQADFALLRENRIEQCGRYRNLLTKVDGAWKFARRELTTQAAPAASGTAPSKD